MYTLNPPNNHMLMNVYLDEFNIKWKDLISSLSFYLQANLINIKRKDLMSLLNFLYTSTFTYTSYKISV